MTNTEKICPLQSNLGVCDHAVRTAQALHREIYNFPGYPEDTARLKPVTKLPFRRACSNFKECGLLVGIDINERDAVPVIREVAE